MSYYDKNEERLSTMEFKIKMLEQELYKLKQLLAKIGK